MASPTTRLLAALELLQAHGQLQGSELAERLGVDQRTVRRYMTRLEELGIPITTERGSHGGYRLVPGFKLPPMMFTDEEALALSVGLLAAQEMGLGEAAPGVASVRAKLERVMPAALRRRVRAADETITLDLARGDASCQHRRDVGSVLATLTAAAQAGQRVRLLYRSGILAETERELDPYGLARRGGHWYVSGHCHLRQGLRTLRVDRILSVRRCDQTFEPPEAFDAQEQVISAIATLRRAYDVEVLFETDLGSAKNAVFEALGILQEVPGGVLLSSQVDDLAWMARELARLPFPFRILRPRALIGALRDHAEQLVLAADRDL